MSFTGRWSTLNTVRGFWVPHPFGVFKKPPKPGVPVGSSGLLNLKNSAGYLDVRLWTVRQLIRDGVLRYVPIGNKCFIDRLDLDKFIEKTKVGVAA